MLFSGLTSKHTNSQDGRSGPPASFFWAGLGLILIGLDQLIKCLIFRNGLGPAGSNNDFIGFTRFHNYQFAFSVDLPVAVIFFIYAVTLAILVIYVIKQRSRFDQWHWLAWTLIFAGAISNIGERVLFGYVRDFLYLYGGGILNLADIYILLGILILLLTNRKR